MTNSMGQFGQALGLLRLPVLWLVLVGWGLAGVAQKPAIEVTVGSNPVRQGQDVQLTVTFKNFTSRSATPEIAGLQYRYGPSTSRNSQWINGKSSSELSYTWTYRVLSDEDITIPPFEATVDGERVVSKPFKLKVLERGEQSRQAGRTGMDDLELVIEVSDRKVVVGEPIVASFVIYNRHNGLDVRGYELPSCDGFWKEEVDSPEPSWEPKVIEGRRYNVANLRTMVLFPQKTGDLVIDGFQMDGYIRTSFFSGQNISASADPVTIQVKGLPAPRPAGNLGAFPRLDVLMDVSAGEAVTNQAFTVDLTFKGQGNLKFVREPDLVWPMDFEVFDPEVKDIIVTNRNGETGSRTFSYVVIPRAPGLFELPAYRASYYDVNKKEYVSLDLPPRTIEVKRGVEAAGNTMSYNAKSDVQVLNQDIRYINTEFSRPVLRERIDRRKGVLAGGMMLGPVLLLGAWGVRRRREAEARDVVGTRRKRAASKLRRELKEARGQLGDSNKFYEAIGKGLEDYLIAKAQLSRSEATRGSLLEAVKGAAPELAQAWDELLSDAEMARFAPGAAAEPKSFFERAEKLVGQTESIWKA